MADEWILKDYMGNAVGTTLDGGISSGTTVFAVVSGTGLPTGSSGPFVVTIDRLGTEEKVLVASRSGNTLTVQQRGYDGTAAVAHLTGVTLDHCFDAHSAKQANALSSVMDSTGSMAYRAAGFAFTELPIGTTGYPIVATATVPAYEQLDVAGVSIALIEYLVPAGTIKPTIAATPDAGYLFINGATVATANILYPYLWPKLPASWKSGTSMVMPDARGRQLFMDDVGTAFTLGAVNGGNTVAVAQANLPNININVDPPSTAVSVSVTVNAENTNRVTRLASASPGTYIAGSDSNGDGATDTGGLNGMVVYYETGHAHTATASGTVDIAPFNASLGGSGTALDNRSAHLTVNYQIKVH